MKKIETLQILQSNAPKATNKSSRKRSSDDNFDFKNALDSKVKEQDYGNQNNSKKDIQSKDNTQTTDENVSKKPEDENLNSVETEAKEEVKPESILNQAVFSANALDLELRSKVRNVQLEKGSEPISSISTIQGLNQEATKQEIINVDTSKTASLNAENTTQNVNESKALKSDSELDMANVVSSKDVQNKDFGKTKTEDASDKVKALGENEDKGIKNIEKNDKSDQFGFEKNDESGDDISIEMLNSAKSEKTEPVETIKIKVGDAQEVSSENLIKEISKNVVIKAEKSNEYELQLDPENLGKIKVKLLFEDGKLTVSMLCSNSKTANLLSEGISSLGQAIQQNTKSEVTVNVREENYLNNNQNQQKGQNGSNQQNQNQQNHREDAEFADQVKLGLWEIENLKRQFSSEFKFM
ncbi:MAG: flagellar hook-length control protein FliK [Proteocatella sp.]